MSKQLRNFAKDYVPTPEQVLRRQKLAKCIRNWLERDDAYLLSDTGVIDAVSGDWRRSLEDWNEDDAHFEAAFHSLQHYLSDADIRSKDWRYAELTRMQLTQHAEKLEAK